MIHKVNMIHAEARTGPELRRAARRRAILDAAREVVHEQGLEALKLAPLAKRLGYAVGALYRYFDSKEALIAALELQILEELAVRLDRGAARAAEGAPNPTLASILARARTYRDMPARHPEDFVLLGFAIGDPRVLVPDEHARALFDAAQTLFTGVATDLEAAVAAEHLWAGDAHERAVVLWSGMQGVLQTRKLGRAAPALLDTEHLADSLVHSLLLGWGAKPTDLERANGHLDTLPDDTWS